MYCAMTFLVDIAFPSDYVKQMLKAVQLLVAFVAGSTGIYICQTVNASINPFLVGVWGFLAAYGFTLLWSWYKSRSRQ